MSYLAAVIYLLAIVAANLSVAHFGPASLPIIAFLLIGLDLSLRDFLHDAWTTHLWVKMGALIGVGGVLTYLINPSAGSVAIASCVAFTAAMTADAVVYDALSEYNYLFRANGSNLAGAVLDSTLFAMIAFGPSLSILWAIAGQILAKATGGALWAWVIDRVGWREAAIAGSLFFGCLSVSQAQDLYVTSHYDVARQEPIVALIHDTPLPGKFFATGYIEAWRNPANGTPAGEWTLFSKHWITRPIVGNLSASLELSFIYNRPGVNFQWPHKATFFEDGRGPYFTPKIGLQYQIY